MIIFVGGLVGAGKSTVARLLAEHFNLYYYDVDEVKKVVYKQDPDFDHNMKHGIPFKDSTRIKVYDRVVDDLKQLSQTHECIVVDETLHKRSLRHRLFKAAEDYFDGYFVIWVKADEAVIKTRLAGRQRQGHILKDAMAMYNTMMAEFEKFEQNVLVIRNNHNIDATMAELQRFFAAMFRFSRLQGKS
ncbi:hypothetical protein CSA57_14585 [candidate division KSB3 bacterium]|nr:MAG: hypothetical protein CSA57_14585 [candidate division KSB3 bacterium]